MALALIIGQLFEPTVLGTGAATLFSTPASPTSSVLVNARIRFANTSGGTVTVTAYAVPSGGAAGPGNCFCNAESIAPNNHADYDVPVLKASDFLQALASAATSVTVSALSGTVMAQ